MSPATVDEAQSRGRVVVAGAGGFVGGHLVGSLLADGYAVRAVDFKPIEGWDQHFEGAENVIADLRVSEACDDVLEGAADVYNLAADMGGIGFIENNKAQCMLSVLINTHLLQAAARNSVARYFYASSACVYAVGLQGMPENPGLREEDAYPADAEDGYGWEKLFSERMCRHFMEDFGLPVRVARYHNVYGPQGCWTGGREKAPAAICRKVAEAELSGRHEIEIWGDGEQTRSFMYVDDCVYGTKAIMRSGVDAPINLGSEEIVTINQLVDLVEEIAGIRVERNYNTDAPKGVRGRSSDNTMIRDRLGWEPSIRLADGLEWTYAWIHDQTSARVGA
jgi:nucleoside-diphosphate-sugar epimerase